MSRGSLFPLGHSFLGRRFRQHLREFPPQRFSGIEGDVSRRKFLQGAAGTAGAALTSSLWMPQFAGANEIKTAQPKPIPGGVSPFGIFIHHFPVLPTGTPLQSLSDPSQITDFKGFVGLNRIRGVGRGSGFADPLAFQADMGFMKGVFIGEDGDQHHGDFGFIWLDIFAGPVGLVTAQIHDYSPPIASNGLFWTIPIDPDSLQVEWDAGRASLHIADLSTRDAHDVANNLTNGHGLTNPPIPPIAPVPATVSFDVEWSGVISRAEIVNDAQNFKGDFIKTGSTIKWSSAQSGFVFESEEPNPAGNIGAVIGNERNGVFFAAEGDNE